MDRRIGKHHARSVAEDAVPLFEERRARRHAGESFMVAQDGGAISIARHERHRQKDVEQPRRPHHQRPVVRIGIGAKRLVPWVEINLLGFAHAAPWPPRPLRDAADIVAWPATMRYACGSVGGETSRAYDKPRPLADAY